MNTDLPNLESDENNNMSESLSNKNIPQRKIQNKIESGKIEYKALLPQYKEFSSDSELNKTKDAVFYQTQKNKDLSIASSKRKLLEDQEGQVIISNKSHGKHIQKIYLSKRKLIRSQKAGFVRSSMYANWSSKQSFANSPSSLRFSETRRLLNSTKVIFMKNL